MVKNYCFLIIGSIFILANIITSQSIDGNYFGINNNNEKSYASFLINIRNLQEFKVFYPLAKKIYGIKIDEEVFQEQIKTKKEITKLQTLLTVNPKQKNILYDLYLLYRQQNSNLAQEYLNKAQLIDPTVK